ncbi:NTP transferase domain-containing protein [Aeromicrobium sp. Marseille-Q0843]|uniref:NTP transferase domain-containing protein n=1 Tax=Aeromicrobium phoceense TaxID=2754045 RepID=A0A838XI69_9ACTN|nr:NTP transferase domain-containing protein [Aeromicrobium phoceense]MBA4608326.1 NTP transferase domain-containing protein [Aeromicrobium phoceense]
MSRLHAIVLAGGRSSRLGGIDKVLVPVDGTPLLGRAIDAVADAADVVVVGPRRDLDLGREVVWVREDPPFAGPAHAVVAGLAALAPGTADEILVLAADHVRPDLVVAALRDGTGNRVAVDPSGRRQWAASVVRAGDLAAAVASLPTEGLSLRSLIGRLDPVDVPVSTEAGADLDTPDDLEEYADDER